MKTDPTPAEPKKEVMTEMFDVGQDEDRAVFYCRRGRSISGDRTIIIPKETDNRLLTLTETASAYIITVTNQL